MLVLQVLLGMASAAVALLAAGWPAAIAALYGAAVALVNTGLLAWHIRRGGQSSSGDAPREFRAIVSAVAQRLAVVVALIVAGIGIMDQEPIALLAGFIMGQLGQLLSGLFGDGV